MYLSRLLLRPDTRDTWCWLEDCHRLHRLVMSGFRDVADDQARKALGVLFRVEPFDRGPFVRVLVQSNEIPDWSGVESRAIVRPIERALDLTPIENRIEPGARFRFRLRANPSRRVHQRATTGPDDRELTVDGRWLPPDEIPPEQRTGVRRRGRPEDPRWVTSRADGKRIGKRVDLRREEERLAWLARRGREHDGFELLRVRLAPGIETRFGPRAQPFATRADPGGAITGRKLRERADGSYEVDHRLTIGTALFEGELEVTDAERFRAAFRNGIGPGKAFGCGLLSLVPISPM